MGEVLQRHGLSARRLLAACVGKEDGGERYCAYRPPLVASLFDNVPPTVNFVTQDEKCERGFVFFVSYFVKSFI